MFVCLLVSLLVVLVDDGDLVVLLLLNKNYGGFLRLGAMSFDQSAY